MPSDRRPDSAHRGKTHLDDEGSSRQRDDSTDKGRHQPDVSQRTRIIVGSGSQVTCPKCGALFEALYRIERCPKCQHEFDVSRL